LQTSVSGRESRKGRAAGSERREKEEFSLEQKRRLGAPLESVYVNLKAGRTKKITQRPRRAARGELWSVGPESVFGSSESAFCALAQLVVVEEKVLQNVHLLRGGREKMDAKGAISKEQLRSGSGKPSHWKRRT